MSRVSYKGSCWLTTQWQLHGKETASAVQAFTCRNMHPAQAVHVIWLRCSFCCRQSEVAVHSGFQALGPGVAAAAAKAMQAATVGSKVAVRSPVQQFMQQHSSSQRATPKRIRILGGNESRTGRRASRASECKGCVAAHADDLLTCSKQAPGEVERAQQQQQQQQARQACHARCGQPFSAASSLSAHAWLGAQGQLRLVAAPQPPLYPRG